MSKEAVHGLADPRRAGWTEIRPKHREAPKPKYEAREWQQSSAETDDDEADYQSKGGKK